ncbi:FecR family protein [Novosphingobium album (ex Liu et al. 2023)]|uniref:FecR domain-containing protein n=1 Tax=Novosphingobium album (ex Liu et al. 2023) TaxID=3031130 RepID=A0ABT5WQL3_9SPHN|nr:FecR domain-containing protein [Novosphingobium album (ex Liu et al. 2023)]MDE8652337.1 FecR domain-containing protein [Novosphingobium album (ex Liu et al. 2023)]
MDTARLWMIRVNEPDFDNWDGLSAWLEADPRHLAAYETALDEDAWAAGLVVGESRPVPFARSPAPARPALSRRRALLAGAIAATLAGVGTWSVMGHRPAGTEIVTAPGEHMSVALSDGTRIALNGGTAISYDPEHPRRVTVERGEALFEVHHDTATPFVVMAGDTRLIDAGTVFNVVRDGDALEVAVAEGAVIYDAARQPIRLEPGDALVRPDGSARPQLRKADPASIGSWREGLRQYDNAMLATVARDLSRSVGKPIHLAPGAERIRYSGTLAIEGSAKDIMARVGPLLGVTITEGADAWEMMPADAAPR